MLTPSPQSGNKSLSCNLVQFRLSSMMFLLPRSWKMGLVISTKMYPNDVRFLIHTLMVSIPKIKGGWYTLSTIRIGCEWKPLRCSSYKFFGHVLDEFPKKVISDALKNMKTPRQAVHGV
ncbi:hypothetical protein Tco_0045910 [Tanacetum coccineum]